jgi:oxysterol-binding protein-related protein 9/10/11
MVLLQGHCGQKTTFATSNIMVKQAGRVKITTHVNGKECSFVIHPLPDLTVSGILSMQLFLELLGKTRIICNGLTSTIEFIPKGKYLFIRLVYW